MSRDRFIIIVTIFIVVVIGILLQVEAYEQRPPVKVSIENETEKMKSAVMGLYDSYQECMINPPAEAVGQVSNYCQASNLFVSESFIKNITANPPPVDPITCSQNPPTSIKVGVVNPAQQTAEVIENFGQSIDTEIKVSLIEEGNSWKVTSITCPLP